MHSIRGSIDHLTPTKNEDYHTSEFKGPLIGSTIEKESTQGMHEGSGRKIHRRLYEVEDALEQI